MPDPNNGTAFDQQREVRAAKPERKHFPKPLASSRPITIETEVLVKKRLINLLLARLITDRTRFLPPSSLQYTQEWFRSRLYLKRTMWGLSLEELVAYDMYDWYLMAVDAFKFCLKARIDKDRKRFLQGEIDEAKAEHRRRTVGSASGSHE